MLLLIDGSLSLANNTFCVPHKVYNQLIKSWASSVRFMTLFNQKGSIFLLLSPTFDYFLLFPTFSFSSLHFLSLLFSCLLFINVRCVCLGIFGLFCYVVEEKWSNLCWIWILHFRVIVFFVIIISPVELWLLYRIYMYSCLIYMFVYFNFFLLFC